MHGLTHYTVESVLGYTQGFFGLVAESWDLTDFDKPWPRGRLPEQAIAAECIVGFLDTDRAAGTESSGSDLRDAAAIYSKQHRVHFSCSLTDGHLRRIRQAQRDLFAQWAALPDGESLALPFPR